MSRDNGGMAARRAILRWAFRMYRRDWRSQAVVLLLLTISVAGAAFGIATTYNIAGSSDATFGRAANFLRYDGADPAQLADRLARTEQWFGTVEEIGHRYAPVPGLFDQVDIRAQQPDGTYGAPMLALREGHYPRGAGDIALTETVAASLKGTVGQTVSLDGKTWTVTGIVENPADLSDRFALVDPAAAGPPQQVTVLVGGTHENLEAFRGTLSGLVIRQSRPTDERTVTAVLVLALATVGLLLVSLVAAAGYLVAAQRRLRQLGLLAAIGATGRHLRLTLLVNGLITGTFSAITGTVIGVAAWIGVAPLVETGAGHRIGRFDLPWLILGAGMLLAVLTATAAAWWPARTAARVPVVAALSGRPPAPKPARRSAILALVLLALGAVVLYLSGGTKGAYIIGGMLLVIAGMLLAGPLAIRMVAGLRQLLPLAGRLAVIDLARFRARSGAALAAITLALAIPAAIVIGTSAAEYTDQRENGLGNLAATQLLVRIGPAVPVVAAHTPEQQAQLEHAATAITKLFAQANVTHVDMAITPSIRDKTSDGQSASPAVELGIPVPGESFLASYPLFVATPELLALAGVSPGTVDPQTDLLTHHQGELQLTNIARRDFVAVSQQIPNPGYGSVPGEFVTPGAMSRNGWQAAQVGWFIQSSQPLTAAQIAAAQDIAASSGLTIESRREPESTATLRIGATAAGGLLALAVLASTVGLIRGEAQRDVRTLAALGMPRRRRRAITAATAGVLAATGAVLGTASAYLVLVGIYRHDLAALSTVPYGYLVAIAAGIPLIAAAGAWAVAGRAGPRQRTA